MASLLKQLLAAAALTTGQAIGLAEAAASENPEIPRAISEMIRSDDEAKRKRETEENFNMKRICKYKEGGFCTCTNPIFRDQNELKAAEEWVDKEHADGDAATHAPAPMPTRTWGGRERGIGPNGGTRDGD